MTNEITLRREFAPITIPDGQSMLDRIKDDLADAADLDVCSVAMAEEAQDIIGRIKTVMDDLDTQRTTLTLPLREGQGWVNAGFKPTLDHLTAVIDGVKARLSTWNRSVAEAKRAAEAKAATERREAAAKIEAEAKKQRDEAQRLFAEAEAAKAKGDVDGQQDLLAQAADVTVAAAQTEAVARQVASSSMRVGSVSSGVKGVRTQWKARIVDKQRALLGAANRPELAGMFDENPAFLNALAKTNQGNVGIPGVEFYEEEIIATRKK